MEEGRQWLWSGERADILDAGDQVPLGLSPRFTESSAVLSWGRNWSSALSRQERFATWLDPDLFEFSAVFEPSLPWRHHDPAGVQAHLPFAR